MVVIIFILFIVLIHLFVDLIRGQYFVGVCGFQIVLIILVLIVVKVILFIVSIILAKLLLCFLQYLSLVDGRLIGCAVCRAASLHRMLVRWP